jgi:hypothetical protein
MVCGTCVTIEELFGRLCEAIATMTEEEKAGLRQETQRESREYDRRFRGQWLLAKMPVQTSFVN